MLTRRAFSWGLSLISIVDAAPSFAEDDFWAVPTNNIQFPKEEDIRPIVDFGLDEPTRKEREAAFAIWSNAPKGPTPFKVAQYFLNQELDSHYLERWPKNDAWNPLVVQFFSATNYRAENDMIPWCAAFVNWCIERSGSNGTRDPSSQSFVAQKNQKYFAKIQQPSIGDIVVFTCHRADNDEPTGLGHVGFVASLPANESLDVLGGNQNRNGKTSAICKGPFPFTSKVFVRDGKQVRLKLNAFVRVA